MLTIRRHQSALFVQIAIDRFVGALVAHFREHLPRHFEALGEDGTRSAIRYGIGRARSYGIESESGVRVFIQMMFVFGPGFDTHPKLPWASRCLTAEGDERTRLHALIAEAEDHLREADERGGPAP
ncbi:Hypothetical protein A7982_04663 [Minicystis rosea]|nr:Hypothetical protein A7982_04663 [Minicystis rosea]